MVMIQASYKASFSVSSAGSDQAGDVHDPIIDSYFVNHRNIAPKALKVTHRSNINNQGSTSCLISGRIAT